MNDIAVTKRSDGVFDVTVDSGSGATRHEVTIPREMIDSFAGPVDETRFVRESFVFLLEREPARSILRRFSLDVISKYFPEYRDEMAKRRATFEVEGRPNVDDG
ncbi:MAG TPA: hypothetical protein VEJ87_05950 [Acidimicrobiales bacterium]|nr:hypothetical protein [Acidimicrobiales bacterium]